MTIYYGTGDVLFRLRVTRPLATRSLTVLLVRLLNWTIGLRRGWSVSCWPSWWLLVLRLGLAMWYLFALLLSNLMYRKRWYNHRWFWFLNLADRWFIRTLVTVVVFVTWSCLSGYFACCSLRTLLWAWRFESKFTQAFHFLLNVSHRSEMFDIHFLAGVSQLMNCNFDLVHENIHLSVILVIYIG